MCVYIYIYLYMYTCVCIYIYIYIYTHTYVSPVYGSLRRCQGAARSSAKRIETAAHTFISYHIIPYDVILSYTLFH